MKTYKLERTQRIKGDIAEVWDFFSNPENLDNLTPPNMGFKILSEMPLPKMHEGQIIEYHVSPILNIPLHWKTEITEVIPYKSFVDNQLKGPYKLWHHEHIFEVDGDEVIMKDIVQYQLPFGILGQMFHPIFIKNKLEDIFTYRYKRVEELFRQQESELAN
ncbi:MAG: SRPBCC family protein [Saprospiraceae bacterium]|nr:SRPBCC family protein [Bacteroidia bacterium]NNE14792.1 SRPBCC family protein [Saprospiraceae bacterium]NNL93449.1 SRPBCC family protein [Saprospiraceae bacterium]